MFVAGGLFLVGILNELHVKNLEVISIAWLLIWTFIMFQVKCPNCGKSVVYKGEFGGISIYAGFSNKSCQNCGYDLTKADS